MRLVGSSVCAVCVGLVAGCSFTGLEDSGSSGSDGAGPTDGPGVTDDGSGPPDGTPDAAPPQDFHLRIEVLVDGMSHLIVKGTTLRWQHYIFAAPGRWNFAIEANRLNGVDWFPTWPDLPDSENRDCNGCMSSSTELAVGVPRAPSTTTLTEVQVRRAQAIVQAPSAANDYELIVEITDYMVGGSAPYIVEVDVDVN